MAGIDGLGAEALGEPIDEWPKDATDRSTQPERHDRQDGAERINKSALTRSHTLGAWVAVTFVAIVGAIPVPGPWKPVVVSISQVVAIAIGGLSTLAMGRSGNWIADRSSSSELRKAEMVLKMIEANPNSSESDRAEIRKTVQQMRMLKVNLHFKRMQAIVRG